SVGGEAVLRRSQLRDTAGLDHVLERTGGLGHQDGPRDGLVGQVRQGDLLDGAELAERVERAGERIADSLIGRRRDVADHAETEPTAPDLAGIVAKRPGGGGRVARVRAGDRVEHNTAVVRGEREWPQLVERPAQRHRAMAADPTVSRTQAADATVR